MITKYTLSVWLIILLCISCSQVPDNKKELESGFSAVDISGDSAVILDPIYVKAIVFKQGNVKMALVECDVTGVSADITKEARTIASQKTGIPIENIREIVAEKVSMKKLFEKL